MPAQQISEQEMREIVSNNPLKYFYALHESGVEQFKVMVQAAESQSAALTKKYMEASQNLFTMLSKELSIFRALEVEMRNDSITPDSLADYLGKLAAFREQVQSDNKARSLAKG